VLAVGVQQCWLSACSTAEPSPVSARSWLVALPPVHTPPEMRDDQPPAVPTDPA
jgi:hypothetical protein